MKSFENIIGYEKVKNELYQVIDMFKNKEMYKKIGANLPRGVIIYGDPGLGKTMLAEAFIKECGVDTFVVKNKMLDRELIREVNNAFISASKLDKAIIFLDDMDKFSEEDGNIDDRLFVAIQANIDSVKDKDILVIATVNNMNKLPESLIRSGRFDRRISVETPSNSDAKKIIEYYLKKRNVSENLNIEDVSRMINYVSCADLESIINDSAIIATYDRRDSIDIEDIVRSYSHYDRNEFEDIDLNCDEEEVEKTALHEAGHVVVAEAIKKSCVGFVNIKMEQHNGISGFTHLCENFRRRPHSILMCLAGKVACELFYEGRCASGCHSDLIRAVNNISSGMYGNATYGLGFLNLGGGMHNEISETLKSRGEAVVQAELERYQFQVRDILLKNKDFVFKVMKELKEKKYLLYSDIQRIRSEVTVTSLGEIL